jgi:hypothetical protein
MRPQEFEHVLAAAAAVTDEEEFVVIGSQAILGSFATPPPALLVSMEVDIYPKHAPEAAIQIDGALGDGSLFHNSFGYYAHGVGPLTAKAPAGWQDRLVRREIPKRVAAKHTAVAWCLEIHDLVLSKCAAGRDRDWLYAREAITAELVKIDVLFARISGLPLSARDRERVDKMLRSIARSLDVEQLAPERSADAR